MSNKEAYLSLSAMMQEKRDFFMDLMKATKFTLQNSSGSYFICGTYEKISEEGDKDFLIRLTKEKGVATIPVSAFYNPVKMIKYYDFVLPEKRNVGSCC
ncbi:MAG: hypothetical protein R2796_12135 [Chitinophagaceae bacterium]